MLAVSSMGDSLPTGIDTDQSASMGGHLEVGATCHDQFLSPDVTAVLTGVPGNYSMDGGSPSYEAKTYDLTVTILGGPELVEAAQNKGGFNLMVTGGTLEAVDEYVQITDAGEATHTGAGNDFRQWNLTWTAPSDPTDAVLFRLTVNAVNGDGTTAGDQWNRAVIISEGDTGGSVGGAAEEHALHVETLGVNWLAYWVGIASFAFMIGLMVIYYFVFRYSETSKATDHRDRAAKNK